MDVRQNSLSTARNREPILAVLRRFVPEGAHVLEIASGAGEHAVFFAARLPSVVWRPSDPDAQARASIAAWAEAEGAENVLPPFDLDVSDPAAWREAEAEAPYDVVVSINMIHISPWEATLGLMAGAARVLAKGGVLFTYGAYKRDGQQTAPSNEAFDEWLKARDPRFGVRDLEAVEAAANAEGLRLQEIVEMPANNFALAFVR